MKPKTKLQFAVIDLSQHLTDIESKMLSWAKIKCLDHKGYATKNRVICLECGKKFSTELVSRKRAVCPHCSTKLNIIQTRERTLKQHLFIASAEIVNDFQVIRNFEVYSYHKADNQVKYYISEILQHWILNDKKHEVVARNHTVNYYCDSWNGNMEIRKDYGRNYYASDKYDVYPFKFHPESIYKPEYLKIGINHNLRGATVLEAIKTVPNDSYAETLLKAKQYSLFSFRIDKKGKFNVYWPSIKICMRNKYTVKDADIWFDYLDLLNYFHKDLRNAHYVCPKDLKKVHDKLMEKKRAIQKKQDEERRKARAIENEAAFKTLKEKFIGLSFSDGFILIKVLESVQEYVEEGDKLHHCVFTNNYFSKPDSLVLSASIENEPVETIEICLKNFKILQCRGKYNQSSKHHDRIIQLMNKNIRKIKELTKQKQTA